jgi:hypothetical protein
MTVKEKELYEPVRGALEQGFGGIGKKAVSETVATKGLGERLKMLIPQGQEILFRFLTRKPDIVGYVEGKLGNTIFVAEVKRGGLTVQDIYQAKMYKELFGATFGFLVGTEPIPEELKRLLRHIPIMLMSADDYTFNFLALGRFDFTRRAFTEWYANFPDTDPFTHLKNLSF